MSNALKLHRDVLIKKVFQIRYLGSKLGENLPQRTQLWKAAFQALRTALALRCVIFSEILNMSHTQSNKEELVLIVLGLQQ